jgi:hypothetical protein
VKLKVYPLRHRSWHGPPSYLVVHQVCTVLGNQSLITLWIVKACFPFGGSKIPSSGARDALPHRQLHCSWKPGYSSERTRSPGRLMKAAKLQPQRLQPMTCLLKFILVKAGVPQTRWDSRSPRRACVTLMAQAQDLAAQQVVTRFVICYASI